MPKKPKPKLRDLSRKQMPYDQLEYDIAYRLYVFPDYDFTIKEVAAFINRPSGTLARIASENGWGDDKEKFKERAKREVRKRIEQEGKDPNAYGAMVVSPESREFALKKTIDWVEKGELHRQDVARIADKGIKKFEELLDKNAIPIEGVKDFEILDKVGRKAKGLDAEGSDRPEVAIKIGVFQPPPMKQAQVVE